MLDTIFEIIYLVGLIVGGAIRSHYTRRFGNKKVLFEKKVRIDTILVFLAGLGFYLPLIYIFTPWLDSADYHLPSWTGWIGASVYAVAIFLLWRSHADLDLNWSPTTEIQEGQTLITNGVFTHIRHPMYAAHYLWGIAQVLLLPNFIAGFAMLIFASPLYFYRVPREESMMRERFGEEYEKYMQRTGRILPRLRAKERGKACVQCHKHAP